LLPQPLKLCARVIPTLQELEIDGIARVVVQHNDPASSIELKWLGVEPVLRELINLLLGKPMPSLPLLADPSQHPVLVWAS